MFSGLRSVTKRGQRNFSVAALKDKLNEIIPQKQAAIASLRKEHGDKKL